MTINIYSHFLSFHEFMSCGDTRLTFGSSAAVRIACPLYFRAAWPLVPPLTLQACGKKRPSPTACRRAAPGSSSDVLPKLGLWLPAFTLVAVLKELSGKF